MTGNLPYSAEKIRESEDYCRDLTRRASSSFGLPFMVLPRGKRTGFEVVYAFMRHSDDLSDDADINGRDEKMAAWRREVRSAFDGNMSTHPILPALAACVREFDIPERWFFELMEGTEMDLSISRYETFDDLYRYCFRVAGVVGLVSLRLFRLSEPGAESWREAEVMAESCGLAFQLTNILRDVKEDIERDRIYLPQEDLRRFDLSEDDLRHGVVDNRFRSMMEFEVQRAQTYYEASAELAERLEADARPCFRTMRGVYHGILQKIIKNNYDVYSERARVPLARKLGIAAKAFFLRTGP